MGKPRHLFMHLRGVVRSYLSMNLVHFSIGLLAHPIFIYLQNRFSV